MKQPGFTLIEILIGIVLASMMSVVLFNSFFQTHKTNSMVEEFTDVDTSLSLLLHQFEQDLSGMTLIYDQKEKKKNITKQCFATSKDKNLSLFAFISTNPLSSYGVAKPRLVRIVYRLEKNKDNDFYTLTRQESNILDYALFEKELSQIPRAIKLSDTIKSCAFSYVILEKYDQNEKPKMKSSTTWNSDEIKKNEKQKGTIIPQWIRVAMEVADNSMKRSRHILYTIPVYGFAASLTRPEKQESESLTKSQNQKVSTQSVISKVFGGKESKKPQKKYKRLPSLSEMLMGGR